MLRVVLVVAGLAGVAVSAVWPPPPVSPTAELDDALGLMQAHAVYVPRTGWPAVIKEAHRLAATAKTSSDTYPAIIYALDQLRAAGDGHARFLNPLENELERPGFPGDTTLTAAPTVTVVGRRLGMVALPGIASVTESRNARHYVQSAHAGIAAVKAKAHPCGWIVDLRNDTGGNVYPMLASLVPILGHGNLVGFTGRSGFDYYIFYRADTLTGAGYSYRIPAPMPDLTPPPAVAVLTGPGTASAGEATAIAFRGRSDTRSFGQPTFGLTNSPLGYPLPDGALILFATVFEVDRDGNIYRHALPPDKPVPLNTPGPPVEDLAQRWLLTTPSCHNSG